MRLALLVLLLLPGVAHADPVSLFLIIGTAVAEASLATLATVASIAITVGTTVFGAVAQKAAAKKAKRAAARARDDFLNSLQDRTVTKIATEAPHVYIYGRAKVGSSIVAVLKSGANEEYKHLVCVHAKGESDGFEEIYINNKPLGPLDADGYVTTGDYFKPTTTQSITETFATSPFTLSHTPSSAIKVLAYSSLTRNGVLIYYQSTEVTYTRIGNTITVIPAPLPAPYNGSVAQLIEYRITYQYQSGNSQVRVQRHLGTPTDPADATLLLECPDKWKSTSVLRGFTYTVIRLDLRQSEFQGGIPDVSVLLRGKKLYDLRTGVTAWSQNPALAIYDYLTSPMCGVDASDIPAAHYITAANVCDETQSFGALYTCNGTVTADQDQANILDAMAQSMGGAIVATTWEVIAGKYVAPIAALSQSDIVGSLAVTAGISDADLFNGVRGQNITSENLYVATDYPPFQNATYLAADGKDKYADVDFPFTDSLQRVHNIARILTEDQRNGFTVKGQFSHKAWDIHIGDRVTFTSGFLGQSGKIYRLTDKKYAPDSSIELTLKEDAASIWDLADTVNIDDTPNSDLPDPFVIAPLSFVTCDSGTSALLIQGDGTVVSRIHVTWGSTVQTVGAEIEIEWKKNTDALWNKTSAPIDQTGTYLSPVEDGEWYSVRGRTWNPYFNVRSDWTYADLHQVIGKSAPPGDITDLSIDGSVLSWTPVTDIDLAGYVFKYHFGSNLDWGTAIPLHTGIATHSPFDLISLPYGAVTIMGKAVDTSGNESVNTAQIFTDLGDVPVANVLSIYAFGPTYPGTKENCSVVGTELVAFAADSFFGDDAQSFYGLDPNSFYKPAAGFGKMVWTSDIMTVAKVLAGSKMTLDMSAMGADVSVEYRVANSGSFYGADDEPFYTADEVSFYTPGPEAFAAVDTPFNASDPNSYAAIDVLNFDPLDPNSFAAVDLGAFENIDSASFYGATGGAWILWPGMITAKQADYQFRITIGSGVSPGRISRFNVTIDAPDIVETISDLTIPSTGVAIPYTKSFYAITVVNATLQANGSGAITVEIDKTSPLAPRIKAYNASHVAVAGSKADILIQGY